MFFVQTRRADIDRADPLDDVSRWSAGRIEVSAGRVERFRRPVVAVGVSMATVWWHAHRGRRGDDRCCIDYHQAIGCPGYLTLDYVHAGRGAGYRSLVAALRTLDEIARRRGTMAIVAHVSTARLSDRFLDRMGWTRHMTQWSGRHFIRRFYDGHPRWDLRRYGLPDLA